MAKKSISFLPMVLLIFLSKTQNILCHPVKINYGYNLEQKIVNHRMDLQVGTISLQELSTSDDPDDWVVDTSIEYQPILSEPIWVIPSCNLPPQVECMPSNNNVAIEFYQDRLFLGFRTSETHFASKNSKIYIISSKDRGESWDYETTIELGRDVREPNFININGQLIFSFFEAGTNPLAFEPKQVWQTIRISQGNWSDLIPWGEPGEVAWDMKVRDGIAYITSYLGHHYNMHGYGDIDIHFKKSTDGIKWQDVNPQIPVVYNGGVSEVAFEFDEEGNLWAITRNEDGDESGFGSHLVFAPANDLSNWQFPSKSDPERYDSPKMIRHGDDLYILARRDIGGPFDQGCYDLPFDLQRLINWVCYSLRPKRTSLYRIYKDTRQIEHLLDLPSAGDTAFLSVRRTGPHCFLIANYTSPLKHKDWCWLKGQLSPEGTSIYLIELTFIPKNSQ